MRVASGGGDDKDEWVWRWWWVELVLVGVKRTERKEKCGNDRWRGEDKKKDNVNLVNGFAVWVALAVMRL